MVQITDGVILCPDCGGKMHKGGTTWSGRKRVQRYQCPACGRKATAKPVHPVAIEDVSESLCPECDGRMVKAGKVWSGRERKQQYLCTGCGRKVVLPAQR